MPLEPETSIMSELTRLLEQISSGDRLAADRLFEIVYQELRGMASRKLAQEKAGVTLQATALVHEVWLRLHHQHTDPAWDSKGHFFSAAAEAMRRILIDQARKRNALKRGGDQQQVALESVEPAIFSSNEEALEFDDAFSRLEAIDSEAAEVVKLRVFAGLSVEQTAKILGVSVRTVSRNWTFARAWLARELESSK